MNLCHLTGHFFRRTAPMCWEWRCALCGRVFHTTLPPLRFAGTAWRYIATLPWLYQTWADAERGAGRRATVVGFVRLLCQMAARAWR